MQAKGLTNQNLNVGNEPESVASSRLIGKTVRKRVSTDHLA